ncbi:MAG: sugar transferase [Planctomycetes bacterium]|nr:sugar transferase [Planctomycetota bacterium]
MMFAPVLIDSRPSYLEGTTGSLLQLPLGRGTVLSVACEKLQQVGGHWPIVLSPFARQPGYADALAAAAGRQLHVVDVEPPDRILSGFELSDWLLFWNPRHFPTEGLAIEELLIKARRTGWVQHLVELDRSPNGTREYAQLDAHGSICRIQRFYDGVTWLKTGGVVCTLATAAVLHRVEGGPFDDLLSLRSRLADAGAPGNDRPLDAEVGDLAELHGYLHACETSVLRAAAAGAEETRPSSAGCSVHPTARLVGPVLVHEGARIEEHATVIGPAIIGRDAQVAAGATLAQSVVLPQARVARGTDVLRSLVLAGGAERADGKAAADSHACWTRTVDAPDGSPATVSESAAEARRHHVYVAFKRAIDALLAAIGLIILAPVLLVVGLVVRVESRGSLPVGHEREGLGGKLFRCWKFRTMVHNAHLLQRALYAQNAVDGPQFKLSRDPRVTRIGDFLRASNLDELPQLWNVLRGQMSLIGPRPSPFRENQICVPWRLARLSVRPGITGLWQICRKDRDGGDFHQWIFYDLLYVKNVSPWLDIKILIATVLTCGGRWSVPLEWMISDPRKASRGRRRSRSADVVSYPFCRNAMAS